MKVEITNQQPQIAVALKKTEISMEQMGDAITEGLTRLAEYLAEQGIQSAGAPYLAYMNCNEDFSQSDIEMGIPVSEAVAVQDEYYMSQSCEGKAIATMYQGAYVGIGAAYEALMAYAAENELELTGVYYDYYISDPANTPESELLTQVIFPIK
ncbi:MAG: GyrI-like domain-containing protein [Coriobacteriia bacterium]|nr:GyrI-like domain-containing protein [Coriobacteriia bacterium]